MCVHLDACHHAISVLFKVLSWQKNAPAQGTVWKVMSTLMPRSWWRRRSTSICVEGQAGCMVECEPRPHSACREGCLLLPTSGTNMDACRHDHSRRAAAPPCTCGYRRRPSTGCRSTWSPVYGAVGAPPTGRTCALMLGVFDHVGATPATPQFQMGQPTWVLALTLRNQASSWHSSVVARRHPKIVTARGQARECVHEP